MGDPPLANFLAEINFISSQKLNGTLSARGFFSRQRSRDRDPGKREKKNKSTEATVATKIQATVPQKSMSP